MTSTRDGTLYAGSSNLGGVRVDYAIEPHCTELEKKRAESYVPPEKRSGIPPPPDPVEPPKMRFERPR